MTESEFILVSGLQRVRAAESLLRDAYLCSIFSDEREEIVAVLSQIGSWRERLETAVEAAVAEPQDDQPDNG